ncbi:uncharacterized protein LOC110987484 [Acanthaster planci]|uniref:Uncharacterized protein LOC110987484 n=1 Tax=Acanthaster planci TaxID=133434 RepID=A0A8B7ZJY1_ACAPL|nr:uncharacterized protein LOC110987484 [Acanthaster planci]
MALWVILVIGYLQISIDSIQAVCTRCPLQWTESQGKCYRYFARSLSYTDAVEYCQHLSFPGRIASLATVTTSNELQFMSKFVNDIFKKASALDVPSLLWLNINSMNTTKSLPILHRSLSQESDNIPCEDSHINHDMYRVSGNKNAVSLVPGPEQLDQACAVHLPVESFIDLGYFDESCISDLDSCKSHSVTWSIWLNIDSPSDAKNKLHYFLSSGGQTGLARGIAFLYDARSSQFLFAARSKDLYIRQKYNISKVPLDEWFHLTFIVDSVGTPDMDLKIFVNGELVQVDEEEMSTGAGGQSDTCTRLFLGMSNTCSGDLSLSQYGGSAAYSSLVVFDGLLGPHEICHLYECRSIDKLVNTAKKGQATIGLSLRPVEDAEHPFTIDDKSYTFCDTTTARPTDRSSTSSSCLHHREHPFICQM